MAQPKRDNELAARALVDAVFIGDAQACAKHKIARRTLQHYRKLLETDKELAQACADHLKEANRRHWGDELNDAITDMIKSIRSSIASLESQSVTYEEHTNALKLKMEFLQLMLEPAITREILSVDTDVDENSKAPVTA